MTKQEFFKELKFALRKHEYQDVEEILEYYDELFMERRELGESEEDVIASFDSIDIIAENFSNELSKTPERRSKDAPSRISKARIKEVAETPKRQVSVGRVISLPFRIIGGIVLCILIFALCVAFVCVVTTLWAVAVSLIVAGIAEMIASAAVFTVAQSAMFGFFTFAVGCVCAALGFFLIAPSKAITKGLMKMIIGVGKAIGPTFSGRRRIVQQKEDRA